MIYTRFYHKLGSTEKNCYYAPIQKPTYEADSYPYASVGSRGEFRHVHHTIISQFQCFKEESRMN